jgi:hypothetical protein
VAVEIAGIGRLENPRVELDRDLEPGVGYQPEVTVSGIGSLTSKVVSRD